MVKILSIEEAPTKLSDFIDSIRGTDQPVMLLDKGEPIVAVLSAEEFEQYREDRIAKAWATIDRIRERNAHLDPDEVYQEVTQIVEEVRQEMYEERQRAAANRH